MRVPALSLPTGELSAVGTCKGTVDYRLVVLGSMSPASGKWIVAGEWTAAGKRKPARHRMVVDNSTVAGSAVGGCSLHTPEFLVASASARNHTACCSSQCYGWGTLCGCEGILSSCLCVVLVVVV
jgi:hypothetical protein